jgi:hypothetical protein
LISPMIAAGKVEMAAAAGAWWMPVNPTAINSL